MKNIDVIMTPNIECIYDLTIDSEGDFTKENSFWMAILLSIFCERRASETEVPEVYKRRGWIGNINQSVEYGSKLWLLYQSRLINDTVNNARTYIEQCLKWFVDFDYLDQITVSTTKDINELLDNFVQSRCAGVSVRRDLETQAMMANIVLSIGGSIEIRRNVLLWQNTKDR